MLLRRWFVDDSLERSIWSFDNFDGNFLDLYCFCFVNARIIDASLPLHWWFVDDSLKKQWLHWEDLNANVKDHWSFWCDNHQNVDCSLLLDWLTVDDPVNNYRRYSEDFDASIYDFTRFFDLISATLLFHSCFVDDSLTILWRDIFETLIISMETFDLYCFCFVNLWNIDVSLVLQWWFVDDSLKKHWWHYEDLDANAKDHWSF